ncbi:hypothetical protein V6N13_099956 [Hibiscus sabdariffa]
MVQTVRVGTIGRERLEVGHLLFAYDSILFGDASIMGATNMRNILHIYEHVATICAIPFSKSGKCDGIIWRLDGSSVYSVKSGYRLLCDDLPATTSMIAHAYPNLVVRFFNEMWSDILPAKVKINM